MPEWWTYSPSDFLMFSPRAYWRLVASYNRAVWPAPVALLVAGALVVWVAVKRPGLQAFGWGVLALAWLWVGWAFHHQRFATINWAANYFALAFALQGSLLAGLAMLTLRRTPSAAKPKRWGLVFVHAGLLYPLLGLAMGRPLAESEVVGLMPEPTALVTLGLLLALRPPAWRWASVIPVASLAIGFTTLVLLA